MSVVYQDTHIGKMWVDSSAPFVIGQTPTTVLQFDRSTDFPFRDTFSYGTLLKYYSIDEQVSTPYAHLEVTVQTGDTGSDWTTATKFAREFSKETLQHYNGKFTGIEGTFTVPITGQNHYRVIMNTYGTDSTTAFRIVAGVSEDRKYRDTPIAGI